jgi:hypothetical protein
MKRTNSEPKQVRLWSDIIVMSNEVRRGALRICPWCQSWQKCFRVPAFPNKVLAATHFCVICHGLVDKPGHFCGPITKGVPVTITLKDSRVVPGRGDYCDAEPIRVVHTACLQGQLTAMVRYHVGYRKDADVTETGWECPTCLNEVFLKFRGRAELAPDVKDGK